VSKYRFDTKVNLSVVIANVLTHVVHISAERCRTLYRRE